MALAREAIMAAAIAAALCLAAMGTTASPLQVGYYSHTCPNAEALVKQALDEALQSDGGIGADLLRMHFHDCFVRGCDGSILIDGTDTEKTAEINQSIENPAFQVVDKAKAKVEAACKGVVSCADILAFLARDAIAHYGGLFYGVPSGRKDGRVSLASDTSVLPTPNLRLPQLTQLFASKGLSQEDMVTLSGAHTIGISHCESFSNRLYKFSTPTGVDPTLDPTYAKQLQQKCPASGADDETEIDMDPDSSRSFDNHYWGNLLANKGLFTSDQSLLSSSSSAAQARAYASNSALFKQKFAAAMVKMGYIGVITGPGGGVRANCRAIY